MTEFFEFYRTEISNLQNLLKRTFSVDFTFLNKEFNTEEGFSNFEEHKVEFEDLDGNPLKLQHLANLSESLRNNEDILLTIHNKSIFNIKYIRPWSNIKFQQLFINKFIREKQYISSCKNYACLIDGKFQIRGFAQSDKPNCIRYLRIDRNTKVVLRTSNKLKISEILIDPRFKDTHHNVDATYLFSNGEFSVKWGNCFNVFDRPDLLADCNLKIRIDPYSKESSLYQILQEIEQLKVINCAVEEDKSSWTLVHNQADRLTVELFKTQLTNLLQNKGTHSNVPNEKMNLWERNVYLRKKDITEILWSLFHRIDNKSEFKNCGNSIMSILAANVASVEFNPNNTTEFSRMLKERFLSSEVKITSHMVNLEFIEQVGLYKLTKDLLYIISNELPELSQNETAEIFNKICKVSELSFGIKSLFRLFTCVSYMEVLKTVLNPLEFKIEASSAVRGFLNDLNFELEQLIKIKMSGVKLTLKSLSSLWIINFISTAPIYSHRAVVFEVENNNDSGLNVYRHDMELSDVQMFP